jgi:hypothetical protein
MTRRARTIGSPAIIAALSCWFSASLFSDLNATALAFLCIFGLSASCAIYLILELNEPFNGLMTISDVPLRNALAPL